MFAYAIQRILYTLPVMLGVSVVCFALVHIAPGDPLISILPPDASSELQERLRILYGFDRSYVEQFFMWLARVLQGDLGTSIASGRSVTLEVSRAVGNTLMLAAVATVLGFTLGCLFGFVAGYFSNSPLDKLASAAAVFGVSVPHYWLGIVLVIVFSVGLGWFPSSGAGPGGSANWRFDYEHALYLVLPAITMAVIPMGIVARTVRALVADILAQEFVIGLRARGLGQFHVFLHVVKNAAPTALAVMGVQMGYLLGGSILIEVVFSWPGTGMLLNTAIFQRDLPLLQGTILVLATFFVVLNLLVDLLQTALDPRIKR